MDIEATPKKDVVKGSCHCGAVKFQVEVEVKTITAYRCNCSICTKKRYTEFYAKPQEFTLLQGQDNLSVYTFGTNVTQHKFCKTCGCAPFLTGDIPELGGPFVGVCINCIDDLTPEQMDSFPTHYFNGKDNDWANPPKHVKYL